MDCFVASLLAMTIPQLGTVRNKSRLFKPLLQSIRDCIWDRRFNLQ
jgi:hypothetical protein